MVTHQRPGWWQRLEDIRRARNDSIKDVAARLGVTPQTLYKWRDGRRPDAGAPITALGEYLGEDASQLYAQLRREPDAGMDVVLRAYAARDLNAMYARALHESLASVLDPQDPGGVELVDIIFRQIRKAMPNAMISVLRQSRGLLERRKPFQYAIHVYDKALDPDTVRDLLTTTLQKLRVPVSLEHNKELLPEEWRERQGQSGREVDDFPTILVPIHLAARAADWTRNQTGDFTALVLGIWYSGAPDIAAQAAAVLGAGSDSITNVTAIAGSWDLGSARIDRQLHSQQVLLAQRITADPSPFPGPFIWANNDVPPILDDKVRQQLVTDFSGVLVVIELDERLLEYAAFRSAAATRRPVSHHLDELREWQRTLIATAMERSAAPESPGPVIHVQLTLPQTIQSTMVDGRKEWPDAVDAMFDLYLQKGDELAAKIRELTTQQFQTPGLPQPASN